MRVVTPIAKTRSHLDRLTFSWGSGSIRKPSLSSGVILRDFSPEGCGAHPQQGRGVSGARQILHGLKAVQDDACG